MENTFFLVALATILVTPCLFLFGELLMQAVTAAACIVMAIVAAARCLFGVVCSFASGFRDRPQKN